MSFKRNVFINCPFDTAYRPLLQPLLFTILYLDFDPLISETSSSSHVRVNEILRRIASSKYSIHDISRSEPLKAGELPRFNMPYEMGLDIGAQIFTSSKKLKEKMCLVLDSDRYRYHSFMSDIAGQDIKDHNNDPQQLIRKVREWFITILKTSLPSAIEIWEAYGEFWADTEETLKRKKWTDHDIDNLSFSEFIILFKDWIPKYKGRLT